MAAYIKKTSVKPALVGQFGPLALNPSRTQPKAAKAIANAIGGNRKIQASDPQSEVALSDQGVTKNN